MILSIIILLLQDLAQVLLMGFCIVPDVFVYSLLFLVLLPSSQRMRTEETLIAAAFIGGLIWDFRWTNLPGVTAAANAAIISAASLFWNKIPIQGRNYQMFAAILIAAQIMLAGLHSTMWFDFSAATFRMFAIQQLLAVPAIIVAVFIYARVTDKHV